MALRPLIYLFLSGCLRQVSLYLSDAIPGGDIAMTETSSESYMANFTKKIK